ncbi:MAG: hypothetical protein JZU65_05885 [Chlorobium sp.]|nr:hypothetical protein [Chlorobium sp.]
MEGSTQQIIRGGQPCLEPASEDTILFQWEFEEVGGKATLIATQDQHAPLSSSQFSGLAIIARIEAFVQAGVFFKAAQWINYKFQPDTLFCAWLKAMLGPEICRELYFSFHLESFGEKEERLLYTSMLIDGPILDMEQEVNKWLFSCLSLHTRIVGFGYHQKRFEVSKTETFNFGLFQETKSLPSVNSLTGTISLP